LDPGIPRQNFMIYLLLCIFPKLLNYNTYSIPTIPKYTNQKGCTVSKIGLLETSSIQWATQNDIRFISNFKLQLLWESKAKSYLSITFGFSSVNFHSKSRSWGKRNRPNKSPLFIKYSPFLFQYQEQHHRYTSLFAAFFSIKLSTYIWPYTTKLKMTYPLLSSYSFQV